MQTNQRSNQPKLLPKFQSFLREREYISNVTERTLEWHAQSLKWLESETPRRYQGAHRENVPIRIESEQRQLSPALNTGLHSLERFTGNLPKIERRTGCFAIVQQRRHCTILLMETTHNILASSSGAHPAAC
ncbi:MAG TPA: hypothetical protein VN946_01260 [Terriglobales bacterium]|jgi:hypothetical protein|nr:hypothetical protein [Terriglobales bacterium]